MKTPVQGLTGGQREVEGISRTVKDLDQKSMMKMKYLSLTLQEDKKRRR
jgi:hypothetical protein